MNGLQWFGAIPFALICNINSKAETPIGSKCQWCSEAIGEFDYGFLVPYLGMTLLEYKSWHRECFIRTISGPIAHVQKRCSCYGGKVSHEVIGMSKREEAKIAVELWHLEGVANGLCD